MVRGDTSVTVVQLDDSIKNGYIGRYFRPISGQTFNMKMGLRWAGVHGFSTPSFVVFDGSCTRIPSALSTNRK
jgi:hypothetical protein